MSMDSRTVVCERIRHAISFPLKQLHMVRDVEDYGHVVAYSLSGWVDRLDERRYVYIKTPTTWKDWVKRGLLMRWPRLGQWLTVSYTVTTVDAWLLFDDLPDWVRSNHQTRAICFDAAQPYYGEGIS